ncbi:MAG TPA: TIGR03943 family protein [Micropruina sp.]|nr:TIGR03943 family protein [Micropruina sp.]HMR22319.1 TIGR03943 family protein [Micropruina sp.]
MSSEHAPASEHGHHHDDPGRSGAGVPWGLLLGLIGAVAICWLALSGQLNLYIHPRYNVFTVVLAGFAIVAAIGAWALRARTETGGRGWGAAVAAVAMVLALFVVPPATLSASTAQQRSPNAGADAGDATRLAGADPSTFALRDWSVLVNDPDSVTTYAGQQVKLIGFVLPVDGQHPDTFYLARFVVTCCTVDARPVAVPVALTGWAEKHEPDQWVEITGRLVPAQQLPGGAVLVLQPSEIKHIAQPGQPYEY